MTMLKTALTKLKKHPENPRIIKDQKFKDLCDSIKEFPEMQKAKPLIVNMQNEVIGGNQRLAAMRHLGYTEAYVTQVDWDIVKQNMFIILDNTHYGDWNYDILANNFDPVELDKLGVNVPIEIDRDDEIVFEEDRLPKHKVEVVLESEDEQEKLYNDLINKGYLATKFSV